MKKRIIPCLDIQDGRIVKGKQFKDVKDVADPVTFAKKYELEQADVLFLLDISKGNREVFLNIIKEISNQVNLPLYVGGKIRTIEDVQEVLDAGATKVSITSAAIEEPDLLKEACAQFPGKIILSIDAKQTTDNKWEAFINGGTKNSGLDVIGWAKQGAEFGASEILLNSIDADGAKSGYDLELNKQVAKASGIHVIASGGAGELAHFQDVLTEGKAQAALAASVFHYEEINITDLKEYLLNFDIDVEEV